jgi:hypothetical protein
MGLVVFDEGGRNVFHPRSYDQVLYVTEDEGIIATDHLRLTFLGPRLRLSAPCARACVVRRGVAAATHY